MACGANSTAQGGVGGMFGRRVNRGHRTIRPLNSSIPILLSGTHSKILRRIISSSGERGKMELRNRGFFKYALKVASSIDARFHGLRPQVKFTRITPSAHMSFGPEA